MAATCPTGFDIDRLRREVEGTYARVARDPNGEFHFHRGLDFACERLGYDRAELEALPALATARFAGVGNPHHAGRLAAGETVVDLGCGAGTDLLLAAQKVAPRGRAIGLDLTDEMRRAAREAARQAGLSAIVEIRTGSTEEMPLETGSVDVVLSNGVLNLAPDKRRAFAEIARVLRPGGRLHLADVVVQRELSLDARSDVELWAA